MPRVRVYIETDVLTEAKRRLHHIFDIFDTVVVMFSGGKDSLATLHLTREVMLERGLAGPLDVVFRDEELIPDEVINFVDEYRRLDWVRMVWYAVPLASAQYVLGVSREYVQWDPKREWVRPKPPWAEVLAAGDDRVFDQYSMDGYIAKRYRGKIAYLTGIRAAESIMRLRSSVNKLNENYINAVASAPNVKLCKPLFDWEENDIFRYFYERKIRYCPLYDLQMWNGCQLRVATPLLAERSKQFHRHRHITPEFYERVIKVFPEMLAHERYYRDLDREALQERYGRTYEGVGQWIEDHITDPVQLEKALKRYHGVLGRAQRTPESYPPRYLLSVFMGGMYKREIIPQARVAR